ncbi:MAG: cob(I)yrinic acid a,c-diamide adenosyltransferase [Zymomonas mobilis subsp. pomaceae]|uniref:Corrinoid adenosyltransferase n=1 Tax=Zymomonas mobilis subsp. pomaceae (strain ATCC 29192 / DSM 22645 / JCM 10191 / CCUG 17912 / NBRC 13757 / NCIMB 11200 / NRRL B-4491 / Barker I) TaxID=579138 RepID=F8EW81_ZYMMT|nr:cob(I)yrinic acid a,c-diamide adenosyltransferase [Zymomonas mobilis]AEI38491.1 ATP/cobalamin adenosyltransferase [Zymomonas mobilis subsp. pomaceae ATCC 29192]MDX5948180.1 cob(I)yrinic acid a,c-diamide adenosyltransferase [Zymomonas mobilis subsp. pomaceae]GEB89880.1 cob(I)yrinic acid a,c-diamide adenosyltransferase [Zymomonas mobilis subsp. pomaceae]
MVKLNQIYTRSGDGGKTGLVDGSRVSKSHLLITAIGEIDETNAAIGVAQARLSEEKISLQLAVIQNDLFDLGADLATPFSAEQNDSPPLRIVPAQVTRLEQEIDQMNIRLSPLKSFILPAGKYGIAELHLARTIARRAERTMVRLREANINLNPHGLHYINRLSDYLFVTARRVATHHGGDILWQPGGITRPD